MKKVQDAQTCKSHKFIFAFTQVNSMCPERITIDLQTFTETQTTNQWNSTVSNDIYFKNVKYLKKIENKKNCTEKVN